MNKKILAVAVAAFVAAPAIAAADTTLYGQLNFEVMSWDGDANTGSFGSRIGVKGSEDLGGGLTGLWQIEGNVSLTNGGSDWNRNTFIGLDGGFGTAIVGRYDHPYKLASLPFRNFGDTMVVSTMGSGVNSVNVNVSDRPILNPQIVTVTQPQSFRALSFLRSSGVVAYVSPNLSGFQVSAATVPFHDDAEDKNRFPFSLAATYRQGPLYATVAYEDMEHVAGYDTWMLGATYKLGDFTFGAMYENWEAKGDSLAADNDLTVNRILVPLTYNLSSSVMLRAAVQYDKAELDGDSENFLDYALGAQYKFSNRTEVYANVVSRSNLVELEDNDTWDFGVGLRHRF